MSKMSKITAFAAPAVMALAVAAPSEAKILLMGDGGWEVSFDGSVNSFYVFSTKDELDAADTATNATHTSSDADGEDTSRITVGLLPAVWGMNIKAPTTNGLDMSSRIGLYPSVQNGRSKNTSSAVGGQNGGNLDLREIFFAVEGSSGKLLVGRTLGLFQGKNILTDMTLFGVGAGSGLVPVPHWAVSVGAMSIPTLTPVSVTPRLTRMALRLSSASSTPGPWAATVSTVRRRLLKPARPALNSNSPMPATSVA